MPWGRREAHHEVPRRRTRDPQRHQPRRRFPVNVIRARARGLNLKLCSGLAQSSQFGLTENPF